MEIIHYYFMCFTSVYVHTYVKVYICMYVYESLGRGGCQVSSCILFCPFLFSSLTESGSALG